MSGDDTPPKRRGFFTTPSWARSAVSMAGLLGAAGCLLGSSLLASAFMSPQGPEALLLVMGAAMILTGVAALATWVRGVRAWKQDSPVPVAWYWPGLAAGVIQGVMCSGMLAFDFFVAGGQTSATPAWLIGVTMFTTGGIPFLGALCCAGAWWTGRYPADGEVTPELQ